MKRIFNSYFMICLVLSVLSIFLIIYNLIFVNKVNLYVFSGYNEDITLLNGSIYTGFDVNHLSSPSIIYKGEEVYLTEYKIGYYIDNKVISVSENTSSDKTIKLSEFLRNNEFSFTEVHKGAMYFSRKNILNIDKLTFIIEGIDKEGNEVNIKIPLIVEKVSK